MERALFQGKFEHTLDDKGRLAIPAHFRQRLDAGEGGEPVLIVTISDQCLAAYPQAEWRLKLEKIAKLNQYDPHVLAFKRIVIGCAQECPVDKAGRILLPPDLRRDARIERHCVILGQLDKLELWGAERWAQAFPQLSDQVGSIYASLADLGI